MKKIIALLLALICLTVTFAGCGEVKCSCDCQTASTPEKDPITGEKLEWEYEEGEYGLILTKYLGNDKKIVMPSVIGNKIVTQITPTVFAGNIVVEEIVFSEYLYQSPVATNDGTYSALGEACFINCKNLKAITMPADWTMYRIYINFRKCPISITTINFPNLETDNEDEEYIKDIFSAPNGITTIACKNKTYTK
ncbi:MAG: hypothetical protein E7648_07470 [Ruminococcaceae bacterium]|nr:hypothetical protein [Oscillospiraceae bacterium]